MFRVPFMAVVLLIGVLFFGLMTPEEMTADTIHADFQAASYHKFQSCIFFAELDSESLAQSKELRLRIIFTASIAVFGMLFILLLIFLISRQHQRRDKVLYARTLKAAEGVYKRNPKTEKTSVNFYYQLPEAGNDIPVKPSNTTVRNIEIVKMETQEIARSVEILEVDVEIQMEIEDENIGLSQ